MLFAAALAGCSVPQERADLASRAPAERTRGLARVAQMQDTRAIPQVVELLDSADPAVRMFAIRTLERLTGETLGYDYAAPEREREEAVDRWVRWVESGPEGAEEPPASP